MVLSPIFLRELLSTLAKEPEKGQDWEKTLSILATRANTYNSYVIPEADELARSSLLGNELPLDGRVPMAGGKTFRGRDGKFGVFYDEPKEKKVLRDWASGKFNEYYKKSAEEIRKYHKENDLSRYQKYISEQLKFFPRFKTLEEMSTWLEQTYFLSVTQEHHLKMMAYDLLL